MGASRSGHSRFLRQRRLAGTADADRNGEVNEPRTAIASRWGALGALLVLQSYGFILAYSLSGAIGQVTSRPALGDIPGQILSGIVGLAFFSVFIYAQGKLLEDIIRYLKDATDFTAWLRETASIQGILRVALTMAAAILYVSLLTGRFRFGFPELSIYILIAYQLFHPLASHFVKRVLLKRTCQTRTVYRSVASQLFGIIVLLAAAGIFVGAGFAMQKEHAAA